jgi:WD40 repeat protein
LISILEGHGAWVISLDGAPDGNFMLSASDDGTVREWDLSTATEAARLFQTETMLKSVRYSSDGSYIAVAGWNGTIWMLERQGSVLWTRPNAHSSHIWRLSFAPDGQTLVSSGDDGVVRLWIARSGDLLAVLRGATTGVEAVSFSPEGRTIYAAGFDGLRSWDLTSLTTRWYMPSEGDHLLDVAVSGDGRMIATCGTGRKVKLRDVDSRILWESNEEKDNLVAVVFGRTQSWLASAGDEGHIRVWRL